jgi:thioester reductase-like protein
MSFACAFVTGGTGLLGINIIKELVQNTSANIFLLVRNPTQEKRDKFFKDLLAFSGGLWPVGFPFDRIKIVEGDVTRKHLGIAPRMRSRLYHEVDIIYHSAAVIKLSGAEAETRAVNVMGTRNVLDFAQECERRGRLEKVVHVSTMAVAGNREGLIYEDDLDAGQEFNNPYEKSKFEAEKIVEEYRKRGLNILIVRPSMVIGHSQTGFTNHFNIFYFQLRLLSQEILDIIPFHHEAAYNLVPADHAARAIFLISYDRNSQNKNFHIVNSYEVKINHFTQKVCDYLGYKQPEMVSMNDFCPLPSAAFDGVRGKLLGIYYPYISKRKIFDAANALSVLGAQGFAWPRIEDSVLTNMLDACIFSGYLPLGSEVAGERAAKLS